MRQFKKHLLFVPLLGLFFTILLGLFTNSAHATSVYDSFIKPKYPFVIDRTWYWNGNSTCSQDVSSLWYSILDGSSGAPASNFYDESSTGKTRANMMSSLNAAIENGSYSISMGTQNRNAAFPDSYYRIVVVAWDETSAMDISWQSNVATINDQTFAQFYFGSNCSTYEVEYFPNTSGIVVGLDESTSSYAPRQLYNTYYMHNVNFNSPDPSYAGELVADGSTFDSDSDGLSVVQEVAQGTRDDSVDSDGDGIGDFFESSWNPDYLAMFCKQTLPYTCADPHPNSKDLFIEMDWMRDGTNVPYKPTSAQLEAIEDMLGNKGVHVYFDLGEYGGGNQLPVYANSVYWKETSGHLDIHDYKYGGSSTDIGITSYTLPAQFDSVNREGIWRYVIYGVGEITDLESPDPDKSTLGAAEPAGDDSIIASQHPTGYDDRVYSDDRAKEGVLAHEMGHLLCLASTRPTFDYNVSFTQLSDDCIFSGVDSFTASANYKSLMNYNLFLPKVYDLATIGYSSNANGTGDHDDWGAILGGGMNAFMYSFPFDGPSNAITQASISNAVKSNDNGKGARDITTFISGMADKKAMKNSKVLNRSPWLKKAKSLKYSR